MNTNISPGPRSQSAARPLRDSLRSAAREHGVPLAAVLELTTACNLRCQHCYVATSLEELATSRWLELIGELEQAGCLHVVLTGGEVALRPDVFAIAAEVKKRRMSLTVLTNGTLVDEKRAADLAILRPVLVAVSIYGGSAAKHEAVTGVEGSFAKSIRAIRALRACGVRCRISCTLMPETVGEFPAIIELAARLDCDYLFDPTVVPKSDGDTDVLRHILPSERLREFFFHDVIRSRFADKRASRPAPSQHDMPGTCGAGMTSLLVEASGNVRPCMGFHPAFGNIRERSFAEVWRSADAEDHRRRMRMPLSACKGCELVEWCSMRCPRLAQVESGDLAGVSSRACDIATIRREMALSVADEEST